MDFGFCVWLTGLSGAGKSTIGKIVHSELTRLQPGKVTPRISGDFMRRSHGRNLGYTVQDRRTNVQMGIHLVALNVLQGRIVVADFCSPSRDLRQMAKDLIPNLIEVYVKTPIEVCMERDPKGLYTQYKRGEIKDMIGLDIPYEEGSPNLVVHTDVHTAEQCAGKIISYLTNIYTTRSILCKNV